MLGAMSEQRKLPATATPTFVIPEIVISSSQSSNSLNRSRSDMTAMQPNAHEECTALLDYQQQQQTQQQQQQLGEEDTEFEQFILNRTTSESNMLESSIYSELQFPHSVPAAQTTTTTTAAATNNMTAATQPPTTLVDMLNTSACSRSDSRQSKRTRRKLHKSRSKCSSNVAIAVAGAGATTAATTTSVAPPVGSYPPQYTTIFLDHNGAAAGATPFLNASAVNPESAASYLQQYQQFYQQNVGLTHAHHHHHLHHARRTLLDVAVPLAGSSADGLSAAGNNLASTNLNMSNLANGVLSNAELGSTPLGYNFRKWFARPSLPFVIGIFALGGVACTLGGIVLGSTGLIEHSTQYLSAALLMIGIGVSLLVISGAIWRLSLPDDVDDCPCFRRMETCRNCNSPHCNNRLLPGSYLYPEFQHRPPPPSYLTSLNEYAFVYHPGAHAQAAAYATVRMNTPPPLYRSTYSLNTSAAHMLNAGISLPPTGELQGEEPCQVICTREALSQTSFKEIDIDEEQQANVPLTREAQSQTLFKEVELD
ncbi:maker76 [Drosophila busckii]|uniref:Maker76 n=2 Tax=Drosophila busckii TaxID=30019 RepID=A0A0M4EGM6_DROBS|nr:maker76 [Drosophila busckii]